MRVKLIKSIIVVMFMGFGINKSPEIEIRNGFTGQVYTTFDIPAEPEEVAKEKTQALETLFPNDTTPVYVHKLISQLALPITSKTILDWILDYDQLVKYSFTGESYKLTIIKQSHHIIVQTENRRNLRDNPRFARFARPMGEDECFPKCKIHLHGCLTDLYMFLFMVNHEDTRRAGRILSSLKGPISMDHVDSLDTEMPIQSIGFIPADYECTFNNRWLNLNPPAEIVMWQVELDGQPLNRLTLQNALVSAKDKLVDSWTTHNELYKFLYIPHYRKHQIETSGFARTFLDKKMEAMYLPREVYSQFEHMTDLELNEPANFGVFSDIFHLRINQDKLEIRRNENNFEVWTKTTVEKFAVTEIYYKPESESGRPREAAFVLIMEDPKLGIVTITSDIGDHNMTTICKPEHVNHNFFGECIHESNNIEDVVQHVFDFCKEHDNKLTEKEVLLYISSMRNPDSLLRFSGEISLGTEQEPNLEKAYGSLRRLSSGPLFTIALAYEYYASVGL